MKTDDNLSPMFAPGLGKSTKNKLPPNLFKSKQRKANPRLRDFIYKVYAHCVKLVV